MSKKTKKVKTCVYCLEVGITTKEHVIARCLFPEPRPALFTVPTCDSCNHNKSKDDDYLRDILVVDANSTRSKEAQELLSGKVFRSISTNRSAVVRSAMAKGKFKAIYTAGGIYLGQGFEFPIDADRVNRIMSLIIRGLYFKLTDHYLPVDCKFNVRRLTPLEFNECWPKIKMNGYNGPYRLGDDVLLCIFNFAEEEPAISQWWLWFYDSVCVSVTTVPANYSLETLLPLAP